METQAVANVLLRFSRTSERRMRTNFVLIDLENVKPASFELLNHDHFRVMVFVGAKQAKVSFDFAESLQRLGGKAEYIRIVGNGPNALDFHIAYYIGRLAKDDPSAYFHIISKDAGFDPLIAHLKTQEIFAQRTPSIDDIPLIKSANSKSISDRIAVVLSRLDSMKEAKPRRLKTLSSTVTSLFPHQLTERDVAELLEELERRGSIMIHEGKVAYGALPSS
jgi:hypothetical protein